MAWTADIGRRGEEIAARFLCNRGWQIKARNYRLGKKEIDIIAEKNGQISLFEIKTRHNQTDRAVISRRQQHNLRQAHLEFCEQNKLTPVQVDYRLIVINYDHGWAKLTCCLNFL